MWMSEEKRGRNGAAQRGKDIAKQHITRRVKKHSNKGRKEKGCQKNIQNPKRSVARYWDRKNRYT